MPADSTSRRRPGPRPLPGTEHLCVKERQEISKARLRVRESEAMYRDMSARGAFREAETAARWLAIRQQHLASTLRRLQVHPEVFDRPTQEPQPKDNSRA